MILLTGATGFLGKIIAEELSAVELKTLGRQPSSDIVCDFTTYVPDLPPADIFVHAAGKAHMVPKTLAEEQEFYTVNVQGTVNILKGLEQSGSLPRSFVFISSVAVYGRESGMMIREDSVLLAADPYGRTKIQAEELISNWCLKNGVICTILRLPLIAGANPPGNLKAMIRGIRKGYYFNIAGGNARKSMVLAKDVARIIPRAAEVGGVYNLTDGYHPSFSEIAAHMASRLGRKQPKSMPGWMAGLLAKAGDLLGKRFPLNSDKLAKIGSDLTFDDSRAREKLGWNPAEVLKEFEL